MFSKYFKEDEYSDKWYYIILIVILFIPTDMLTTLYLSQRIGLEYEANWFIKKVIEYGGIDLFILLNFIISLLSIIFFYTIIKLLSKTSAYKKYLEFILDVWLLFLLLIGILVVVNNLIIMIRLG